MLWRKSRLPNRSWLTRLQDTDKAGIPENLLTFRNTEVDSDSQWAKRYRIELSDADIFYHPEVSPAVPFVRTGILKGCLVRGRGNGHSMVRRAIQTADLFVFFYAVSTITDRFNSGYRPTLKMYGKPYVQSRSIASYATSPDLSARYSGHSVQMNHSYPALLVEIQNAVSTTLGIRFDHVMLNWYQDGSVHIGKHRDTKENQVCVSQYSSKRMSFLV